MRSYKFQELRGLCIIAVILIHLLPGSIETNSFDYWLSFRRVINFPVAIFIFISGYFLKLNEFESGFITFYKKKFIRLVIPYFVWSLFFSIPILKDYHNLTFNKIFEIIFFGAAADHLYFIVVLLQLILITPLIISVIKKKSKWSKLLLYSLTPIYIFFLYYYNISTNSILPNYHKLFPAWILFYILGILMRNNLIKIDWSITTRMLFVIIAIILSMAEANLFINYGYDSNFASSQITVTSFLYSLSLIILFNSSNTHSETYCKTLVKVGNYSFGIYFIHIFYLSLIHKVPFTHTFSDLPQFLLYQFLVGVITIILSYFTVHIATKLLGSRLIRYLGFN